MTPKSYIFIAVTVVLIHIYNNCQKLTFHILELNFDVIQNLNKGFSIKDIEENENL